MNSENWWSQASKPIARETHPERLPHERCAYVWEQQITDGQLVWPELICEADFEALEQAVVLLQKLIRIVENNLWITALEHAIRSPREDR